MTTPKLLAWKLAVVLMCLATPAMAQSPPPICHIHNDGGGFVLDTENCKLKIGDPVWVDPAQCERAGMKPFYSCLPPAHYVPDPGHCEDPAGQLLVNTMPVMLCGAPAQ